MSEEKKETAELKDKELKQVIGGLYDYNWVCKSGKIVSCKADCLGWESDACSVKENGECKFNH